MEMIIGTDKFNVRKLMAVDAEMLCMQLLSMTFAVSLAREARMSE